MRPLPKRPTLRRFAVANRTSRDRPEAAAELVRLEYERQRLTRAIAAFELRRSAAYEELAVVECRITWVHGMLGMNAAAPAPPPPVAAAVPASARRPAPAAPARRTR
jgi:hypothetical protein